jgi:hypothetical protein
MTRVALSWLPLTLWLCVASCSAAPDDRPAAVPAAAQPSQQQPVARPPAPQPTSATPLPSGSGECVPAEGTTLSSEARTAVAAFRESVESAPLFVATGGRSAVVSCRITMDDDAPSLEYRFRNGGSLTAAHDDRIEYTEQVARLAAPPSEDAVAILKRAERAAFGAKGCGIDWRHADKEAAGDQPGAVEMVYRGEECNCQARVGRDAGGRVVGLTLRSAC